MMQHAQELTAGRAALAASSTRSRDGPLAGLEWLRIAACIGIVAFHMHVPGHRVAYGGLTAFAILTVALAARSAQTKRSLGGFATTRVRRLLLPLLFWSGAYGLMRTIWAYNDGRPPLQWMTPEMLWTGPSIHLWYLPFAMFASVLAGALTILRSRSGGGHDRHWGMWLVSGVLVFLWMAHLNDPSIRAPVPQWMFVLPTIPLGMALATIQPATREGPRRLAVMVGGMLLACFAAAWTGDGSLALPYAAAVMACALAWVVPWRAGEGLLRWSRLTFGVYLVHPFFILVMYRFAAPHAAEWTGVVAVIVLSAIATAILQRTALRATV